MSTVSVTQARAELPDLLDRVEAGDEVTITRHGKAIAVVVRPDALRARRADQALADAERVRDLLDRGRRIRLSDAATLSSDRAEALAREVTAARER